MIQRKLPPTLKGNLYKLIKAIENEEMLDDMNVVDLCGDMNEFPCAGCVLNMDVETRCCIKRFVLGWDWRIDGELYCILLQCLAEVELHE